MLCSLMVAPFSAIAQQKGKGDEKVQNTDFSNFSYTSQDRRDPFEPIYLTKMKKNRSKDTRKVGYELEELKLVGVMKTGAVKFAMMEDLQGRGVVLKQGGSLNKNPWLVDVLEDQVLLGYRLRGDIRKIAIDIPRK